MAAKRPSQRASGVATIRPKPMSEMGDTHVRGIIYGQPGVGKTVLTASAPRTLTIVNDPGEVTSAKGHGSTAHVLVARDYAALEEIFEYVRHEGVQKYDHVVVDNLTLMQDQGMDAVMLDLVTKNPARNRYVPDMHEYLVNQNNLSVLIRMYITLPMHVWFTAHEMFITDPEGSVASMPMLQGGGDEGKLSQKVCGYMNVVGRLSTVVKDGKSSRSLLLDKKGKYYAKCRFAGLPPRLPDPTMSTLMKAIEASMSGQAKPAKRTARKTPTRRTTK